MSRICSIALLTVAMVLAESRYAFAYIDPGILGLLYQSAYAFLAGAIALWVVRPWQYIRNWFKRDKPNPVEEEEASQKDG